MPEILIKKGIILTFFWENIKLRTKNNKKVLEYFMRKRYVIIIIKKKYVPKFCWLIPWIIFSAGQEFQLGQRFISN